MKKLFIILSLTLFILSCSSSEKMIKGTNIPATDDNTAVVDLLKLYNTHLENMDIDGLMEITSKSYFDNSGTDKSDDDFGYSQLKDILVKRFKNVKEIHQKMTINSIIKDGDTFVVNYTIDGRFLMAVEGKTLWVEKADRNEIIIVKKDDTYKIKKGM